MIEPCHIRQHDFGLVRVSGTDARAFLQAQTTQAIADLPDAGHRLAAWLNAKGRVRAMFDVIADGESFWLVTPADNADYLIRHLGQFVLRADVRLDPAPDRAIYSVCGENEPWLAAHGLECTAGVGARSDDTLWFRIGLRRVDVIGPAAAAPALLAESRICPPEVAGLEAIALGLPQVTAALRERYIPQMLNLDRLDAISFTKGCYPGQEIVARTTNLGEVKRRLERFATTDGERPIPGTGIVDAGGQSVGEINRVAATGSGYELLGVVQLTAASDGLMLATDGRQLERKRLDYET